MKNIHIQFGQPKTKKKKNLRDSQIVNIEMMISTSIFNHKRIQTLPSFHVKEFKKA